MNVLYLHGLESQPGGPKVKYLQDRFDSVYAPPMDYKNEEMFQEMLDLCAAEEFDLIIGSSMGGYIAHRLATHFENVEVMLFNPAIHSRSINPAIDFPIEGEQAELQERKIVVLGKDDKVIDPELTKMMLEENRKYTIIEEEMAHQVPLGIFIDTIINNINEL